MEPKSTKNEPKIDKKIDKNTTENYLNTVAKSARSAEIREKLEDTLGAAPRLERSWSTP